MGKTKYERCRYVKQVGSFAVFVTPGCPRATMIKGTLVSSKRRCEDCASFQEDKGKQKKEG